jgi:hypothetical protein
MLESAALEALIEVVGILLPNKKASAEERDVFVQAVFSGPSFAAMDGGCSLVNLARQSGRDWSATSDALIAELARLDLGLSVLLPRSHEGSVLMKRVVHSRYL